MDQRVSNYLFYTHTYTTQTEFALVEQMINKKAIDRPSISEIKNSKAILKQWTIKNIIDGQIPSSL